MLVPKMRVFTLPVVDIFYGYPLGMSKLSSLTRLYIKWAEKKISVIVLYNSSKLRKIFPMITKLRSINLESSSKSTRSKLRSKLSSWLHALTQIEKQVFLQQNFTSWFNSFSFLHERKYLSRHVYKFQYQYELNVYTKCGFWFESVRFAVLLFDWFGYDHP
jgi:hypothetical protein